jgi:hypothetical protein
MRYLAEIAHMDESRNESEHRESTPLDLDMETPMNTHMVQEIGQDTEIPPSKTLCAHQRLIDDVRTRSGTPTGKVRCLECGAIFDDPHRILD